MSSSGSLYWKVNPFALGEIFGFDRWKSSSSKSKINFVFDGDEWTKADGICTVQDITTNKEKNELDVYLQDFMYILERMTKRIIASALK